MDPTIVHNIDRPPADLVDAFSTVSAADAHEAMEKAGAMAPAIGRVTGERLCGPATTVKVPTGDNMMVHAGAKLADPGDVLVIEASTTRAAVWGELTTRQAIESGLEGIVTGGNVRDVDEVSELGFPTFARAASQSGAVKATPGSVNVPVVVGGVAVSPGDMVIGDGDGVTVVPRTQAADVLTAVSELHDREAELRTRLDAGETLYDIAGYEEVLNRHGLTLSD
jgi:4-hydroxy-4-methyl-2-oxoglutarate aldolase